jgi:cell division protein FtsW
MTRRLKLQDPLLFGLILAATFVGLVFIFDAGYARAIGSGKGMIPREFLQQLIYLPVAIFAGVMAASVKPKVWRKWAPIIWAGCILLLILVRLVGTEMNGAKRWLPLGPIGLQPAEFAKFATVLYLAGVFADRPDWSVKIKRDPPWYVWMDKVFVPKLLRMLPAFGVLVAIYLIEKEPDLGTAAVVAVTAFTLMFVGRVSNKSMIAAVIIGALGVVYMVKAEPYRLERIQNHQSRWTAENIDDTAYQTVQSEYGMASGGLFGVGFGAGRAKHVMPAATTDFISSTIAEETGLVGMVLVLGLLAAIVWRLIYNAARAATEFGRLILIGTATWIGLQATVNIMMANAYLPAIGIPLPFISSGGSSLLALWIAFGVCQTAMRPELALISTEVEEAQDAAGSHGGRDRRARLSRA